MKRVAVIMAGGKGERLWPLSRPDKPKQFLSVTSDEKTLLQLSVQRALWLVDISEVFIITGEVFVQLVQSQIPDLPLENIIVEPCGRNTAPAILLSALVIQQRFSHEEVTMMVFPSDHLIENEHGFVNTLNQACEGARNGYLVTVGVKPTFPETGYGYIEVCEEPPSGCCPVKRFVEKPDKATALQYFESGHFYWNAGIFTWKVSDILDEFQQYMPRLFEDVSESFIDLEKCNSVFSSIEAISIDYAVLEKSQKMLVVLAGFGWDDVGSFVSLSRHNASDSFGNTVISSDDIRTSISFAHGDIVKVDNPNRKEVVIIGLSDCTLIDTEDVLLLCANEYVPQIKKCLDERV